MRPATSCCGFLVCRVSCVVGSKENVGFHPDPYNTIGWMAREGGWWPFLAKKRSLLEDEELA